VNHPHPPSPAATPPVRPAPQAKRLRHCDVGDTVTNVHGRDLVVLSPVATPPAPAEQDAPGHDDDGIGLLADWVHVYADETGVTTAGADDVVVPIHANLRQVQLLRDAVADLSYHHEQLHLRRARHRAQLLAIRQVLIDHHRAGYLTVDGLGQVLAEAGLAPYRPRLRVRFTITGSYDIDAGPDDLPEATAKARGQARHLLVDFAEIDDLHAGSPDLAVHIDDISAIDL
jgi:hypothetical protein